MARVTATLSVSVDGYAAGTGQRLDRPLGDSPADELHRWMFEQPEENRPEREELLTADAYIMGRNMFGPGRGAWDPEWKGWWGDEPPYRKPVFVLTHHERPGLEMAGGTTFHFVTGGIHEALERARKATGDGHVRVAGGATTTNQFLAAGLVDELFLQIAPVTLGAGEKLFDGVPSIRLEQVDGRVTALVTHVHYRVLRA